MILRLDVTFSSSFDLMPAALVCWSICFYGKFLRNSNST
jgi:hypothetical protein